MGEAFLLVLFEQEIAGSVGITATRNIIFDGETLGGTDSSGAFSQVGSDAEGDAGGMTISTNNLTVTNGGQVDATTFGRGNAGTIDITATGDITFDGVGSGAFSEVGSDAEGDAGGMTISTNNLTVTNGGQVSASTGGRGNAGTVDITATGDITFDGENLQNLASGVASQVFSGAEGDAGGVTISTNNLTVTNGGQVSATTFGQGNAGTVDITATGDITFDGENLQNLASGVTSRVSSDAEGDAGGVTISTNNLTLTNGGRVSATTNGQGNAGTVDITATGDITFDGSGVTSLVSSDAEGDAGGVTISTNNLTLTNGGQVTASTFGRGDAGNLTVTASESIELVGSNGSFPSGLFANTIEGNGNGGNLSIATDQLILRDQAVITVGNFQKVVEGGPEPLPPGTGAAGNLEINAGSVEVSNQGEIDANNANGIGGNLTLNTDSLTLENEASISASTTAEQGQGGIMTLNIDDFLLLRDRSRISASADRGANGGNININGGFVVAFPNQNNDIIASAVQGRGGNINITNNGLFGIEERPLDPVTNDINASSEFGLDGTIAINQLDVNPVEALEELPMSLIDVVGLVAQNLCQQGKGSEFIVTGKGGVAQNPSQVRDGEISDVDLVAPATGEESEKVETVKEAGADREIEEETEIIEAQGWIINDRGNVELVAHKTDVNGAPPQPKNDKICRR